MIPFISVPLKTTDEIDWAGPLKRYIATNYGDADRYAEECETLNGLRRDARGAGRDTTGRDLLYRYYAQLELLDLRFPIDENNIRISFNWYDALQKQPISQYSLAYEKASVIFNIGAVLSAIAQSENRSEVEGLKRAFRSCQASAGMFGYINENFLHAPSPDLARECVKSLSNAMLAQAQECVVQIQLMEKKKSGTIAKVSAQAAMLYQSSADAAAEITQNGTFDRNWTTMFQLKAKYYDSLAQYHQAVTNEEAEEKYGESIARLNFGEASAKEALRSASLLQPWMSSGQNIPNDSVQALSEAIKGHITLIIQLRDSVARNNDLIYNEPVPHTSILTGIPKLAVAKTTPVQELYTQQELQKLVGAELLSKIMPMSVTQSASLYSEEKAKLLRGEQEKCDLANGTLASTLKHLGLPEVLERFKGEVPQDIKRAADEIARDPLTGIVSKIESLKREAGRAMRAIIEQFDKEQRESQNMRQRYGNAWTQEDSSAATANLRGEIQSKEKAMEMAARSDAQLIEKFNRIKKEIGIMEGGSKEVAKSLSSTVSLLDIDDPGTVEKVEKLVQDLNIVKRERMQTLTDLRDKIHKDDISDVLILNKKNPNLETQVFASELEKFHSYQTRIQQSVHRQEYVIQELVAACRDLVSTGSDDHSTKKFTEAAESYTDLKEGFSKGLQFYTDLSNIVKDLESDARKIITERRQQGADLFASIKNSHTGVQQPRDLREQLARMNLESYGKPEQPSQPWQRF